MKLNRIDYEHTCSVVWIHYLKRFVISVNNLHIDFIEMKLRFFGVLGVDS